MHSLSDGVAFKCNDEEETLNQSDSIGADHHLWPLLNLAFPLSLRRVCVLQQ